MRLTRTKYNFLVCPQCGDLAGIICVSEESCVCVCECPSCGNIGDSVEFRHVTEIIWLDENGDVCKPGIADIFEMRLFCGG